MYTAFMPPRRPPGYMTEDLELQIVSGPPRYTSQTTGPVEHITLERANGEPMGYIYANDADDAAGWVAFANASSDAWNDAAFWIIRLQKAKARSLTPTQALDELLTTTTPGSRVIPGSRATSPSLDALKALAGIPKAEPTPAPRRRGEPA